LPVCQVAQLLQTILLSLAVGRAVEMAAVVAVLAVCGQQKTTRVV
jgi:hypothetical protein